MNEDEIIEYTNNIINATFIEATLQDKDGNIIEQGFVNKDVIKGLLDLYQKEKEKNSKTIAHIKACRTNFGNYILSPSEIEYLLELLEENNEM